MKRSLARSIGHEFAYFARSMRAHGRRRSISEMWMWRAAEREDVLLALKYRALSRGDHSRGEAWADPKTKKAAT